MNKKINIILNFLQILIILLIVYFSVIIIEKINLLKYAVILLKLSAPLFIGVVIAWLLNPIVNKLNIKLNRTISCIILYIFIIFSIYLLIINFIPTFINEFDEFIKMFPNIIDKIFNSIKIDLISNMKEDIICGIDKIFNNLLKTIPDTCLNIISSISNIIIGLIISFYLLISNKKVDFKRFVKKKTYNLLVKINDLLKEYVKATLLSSFVVFILSTLSFYILGLKNAFLYGFICGLTNIIPFIGPYVGASIPVLISFTKSISFGIIVSVVIFVIQAIEGNIIGPLIMSKSINIHPVTTIIGLLIFGYFFGIVGMIVGVPIIAISKEIYLYYKK